MNVTNRWVDENVQHDFCVTLQYRVHDWALFWEIQVATFVKTVVIYVVRCMCVITLICMAVWINDQTCLLSILTMCWKWVQIQSRVLDFPCNRVLSAVTRRLILCGVVHYCRRLSNSVRASVQCNSWLTNHREYDLSLKLSTDDFKSPLQIRFT